MQLLVRVNCVNTHVLEEEVALSSAICHRLGEYHQYTKI